MFHVTHSEVFTRFVTLCVQRISRYGAIVSNLAKLTFWIYSDRSICLEIPEYPRVIICVIMRIICCVLNFLYCFRCRGKYNFLCFWVSWPRTDRWALSRDNANAEQIGCSKQICRIMACSCVGKYMKNLTCFNSCFIKRALPCLSTVALLLKCVVIDFVVLSDIQVGDDICESFFQWPPEAFPY